jgi:hypothetical protein
VLEQRGLVDRAMENAWLAMPGEVGPLDDLIGHSITYRIAVGPRTGQKQFTLQTVAARAEEAELSAAGFHGTGEHEREMARHYTLSAEIWQ